MVCVLFELFPIIFFHNARAWVIFKPHSEAQKSVGFCGLKEWDGLDPLQGAKVGLQAFVTLGTPKQND